MKARELNILANFMDDLPSDRMHMAAWASSDFTLTACGSAGCACGWAATLFHKSGWRIALFDQDRPVPAFDGRWGSEAFAVFFEIPISAAEAITLPDSDGAYKSYHDEFDTFDDLTPRMVAKRIRDVIRALGGEVVEDYPVPEVAGVVA